MLNLCDSVIFKFYLLKTEFIFTLQVYVRVNLISSVILFGWFFGIS
jgi:hypothetical protein